MKAGFLGLGEMGLPMARNLVRAGHEVSGYDIIPGRLAAAEREGVKAAESEEDAADGAEVILLSLPSPEVTLPVLEEHFLPVAAPGQVFIDLGTTNPSAIVELSLEFANVNAILLDIPVSGGPQGAENASLYMFAGGDEEAFRKVLPLLEKLGRPDRITYCGPSGSGQSAKGVNQLAMGLSAAGFLEAVAFGVHMGLEPEVIGRAIADPESAEKWRAHFATVARMVATGRGREVGVKFRELPYFLKEADDLGFALPLTETLHSVLDRGECVTTDDHRPAPSLWHELAEKEQEDR